MREKKFAWFFIFLNYFFLASLNSFGQNADDDVKVVNAKKWLDYEVSALKNGWGAKGQYPRGVIDVPRNTNFTVNTTLQIPTRVCLKGDELHQPNFSHRSSGFKASELLAENNWVLKTETKQKNKIYNGNFGTHYHNIFVQGNRKSYGLLFGGAQCSSLVNYTGINCSNYNLLLGRGSRNLRLQTINLTNYSGPPEYKRIGTGLHIGGVDNANIIDLAAHSFKKGVVVEGSQNIVLIGANFEKVDTPISVVNNSSMVSMDGTSLQYGSHILIDLTRCKGGTRIRGMIKHSPWDAYEAIKKKQPLPTRTGVDYLGNPLDPKGAYLKDTDGKLRLITVAAVKHNLRRGFIVEVSNFGKNVEIKTP